MPRVVSAARRDGSQSYVCRLLVLCQRRSACAPCPLTPHLVFMTYLRSSTVCLKHRTRLKQDLRANVSTGIQGEYSRGRGTVGNHCRKTNSPLAGWERRQPWWRQTAAVSLRPLLNLPFRSLPSVDTFCLQTKHTVIPAMPTSKSIPHRYP